MKGHRISPLPSLQKRAVDKVAEARALLAEAAGLLQTANDTEDGVWRSIRWKSASDGVESLARKVVTDVSELVKEIAALPPENVHIVGDDK